MKPTEKKDTNYFANEVGEKANRKLKALGENKRSVWFGLGMFGIIGWTVAVPTLLGAALGIWMDKKYPQIIFLDIDLFDFRSIYRMPYCVALDNERT